MQQNTTFARKNATIYRKLYQNWKSQARKKIEQYAF